MRLLRNSAWVTRKVEKDPVLQMNRACSRTVERTENVEQRALARTGCPDDRNEFTPLNLKIDPLEHGQDLPGHGKDL